jgi:tetratricopeptide (TPR) repeat protein
MYLYWDKALDAYHTALRIDPKFPAPHFKIGELYRTQSFWRNDPARKPERVELARKAIDAYKQSLKLNPRQVAAWLAMAKAHDLAGDVATALRAFEQAIALAPTSAQLYQELGIFYRDHGDRTKALAALEKSVQLHWTPINGLILQDLKTQ